MRAGCGSCAADGSAGPTFSNANIPVRWRFRSTVRCERGQLLTIMAPPRFHLAIDLGAASGRAVLGALGANGLELHEVHRFTYAPRRVAEHLRWDAARLFEGVRASLGLARATAADMEVDVISAGVDSWGIDYGLVDGSGQLVEDPVCYRDERTSDDLLARVFARVPREELFARTGIQILPFNTVFQLAAARGTAALANARTMLLMPDLLGYWLTGEIGAEVTNASTTGLLDARSGTWDNELAARLGIVPGLLPPLYHAGTIAGPLRTDAAEATGKSTVVTRVGSHAVSYTHLTLPTICSV